MEKIKIGICGYGNLGKGIEKEISKSKDMELIAIFTRREPSNIKTFVIERSSSLSWYKYVKDESYLFTIDKFGASGSKNDVDEKYGFTREKILSEIERKLN